MPNEFQVTLAPEVAAIVVKEAARLGTSPDAVANDAIRQQYADLNAPGDSEADDEPMSRGETLADRFAEHIGVIDTGGANLSVDTSKKYSDSLHEEHLRKRPQ